MSRRIIAMMTMAAVAASAAIFPAEAQEPPPEVPEEVQIEDPAGDANYLNGQGVVPDQGDHSTAPASLSVSDLLKVWFTNDAENISVHVQTTAPPPATNASYIYRVMFNPGDVTVGCLWFEIVTEGPTWAGGEMFGRLRYVCSDAEPIEGEVTIAEGPDDTGITTLTLSRSVDTAFADGAVLAAPSAEVRNNNGAAGVARVTFPVVDDTQVGTDYTVKAEEKKKKKKKKKKKRRASAPGALLIV